MRSACRRLPVVLVALVLAPASSRGEGPSPTLPDDVFARPASDDVIDLLLIGNARAAVVRVHLTVGGKSFRESWGDFAVRLHAFLDRDGDRVLTADEAKRVPLTNFLHNPVNAPQVIEQGMRSAAIDANPRDGKIHFDELVKYLHETENFAPLAPETGTPADPRGQAVFSQLDRDGDKVITPGELSETDALFATLDRDEDETLSLAELTPHRSPLADRFRAVNPRRNSLDHSKSAIIPLTSPVVRAVAATRLLDGFGRASPGRIGALPLAADPLDFNAADGNRDGWLDGHELRRYLESPTIHQELAITLPPTRFRPGRVEPVPDRARPSAAGRLTTRAQSNGGLVIEFAGSDIEFLATDTPNNLSGLIEGRFLSADANKDGVVDAQEVRGDVLLQRIYSAADRNGDDHLTRSEIKDYVDLTNAAEAARIVLRASDQWNALHERLDANRDGRFSVRELRAARAKLANLDADHDGRISLAELPRRTQLNFGRGPDPNRNRVVVATTTRAVDPLGNGNRPNLPAWFVGMDRNADGDVSPREFLGTPDQFRRFDADRDGLIDGDEAARQP